MIYLIFAVLVQVVGGMDDGGNQEREGGGGAIRPPIFSGETRDWATFWMALTAYATFKNFIQAIRSDPEDDSLFVYTYKLGKN